MTESRDPYPVHVDATLDPSTSRGLWLTDAYPPFRLDQGGTDPGPVPASPAPAAPLVPAG